MKAIAISILVVGLFGLLAYTNPTMDDYEEFIEKELKAELEKKGDGLERAIGVLVSGLAGDILVQTTTRANYVFFSIFDTDLGKEKIKSVGVFKNFIPYETPESLK